MAAELNKRRQMVTMILDAPLHGLPEEDKTELVRALHVAIHKQIDAMRDDSYENRLAHLIRLFDDVKPLARQLLWEELVSLVFHKVQDKPSTKDVSRKRVEQERKDSRIPKGTVCPPQEVFEMGGCV